MKKLIIIESAKEFFDFAGTDSIAGMTDLSLPADVRLIFENNMEDVRIENAGQFMIDESLGGGEFIEEAFKRLEIDLHIT